MEFKIGHDELRYVAGVMAELGEVVISPTRNSITASDYNKVRRIEYKLPDAPAEDGQDISVDIAAVAKVARRIRGEVSISLTQERFVVGTESTNYRLRLMIAPEYFGEPVTEGTGKVIMPATELRAVLGDVEATDAKTVIIAVDDGAAQFNGEGASDCWITADGAEATGIGYSKLDLELLLPCIPKIKDCMAAIDLSPKGATAIKFGDNILFHQGGRLS